MELNREQIVKALECCTRGVDADGTPPCDECPYEWCNIVGGEDVRQRTGSCQHWLKVDALALIRELTEEKERIAHESACHRQTVIDNLRESLEFLDEETERVRADTVRKFAERLEESINGFGYGLRYVLNGHISKVAREMMEESDDNT